MDIDPQALLATRENAERNGVLDRVQVTADREVEQAEADVLLANILAGPLVDLAPLLAGRTRVGGRIALSGLLVEQADAVTAAYRPWFDVGLTGERDGWGLLTGCRRARRPEELEYRPMYSQCPECLTRFRVPAAALRAAHGTVRCGQCGSAFDALPRLSDTLQVDGPASALGEPGPSGATSAGALEGATRRVALPRAVPGADQRRAESSMRSVRWISSVLKPRSFGRTTEESATTS